MKFSIKDFFNKSGQIRMKLQTFEYNSKLKYKHSNLRLKHYLHNKVKGKEQIKPIKHADLDKAFHICNLFFNYTKILH